MSSRTNWPAVSAIAACAGVFVAFLAYATPHPYSPPAPTPPTTSWPATTVPEPPPQSTPGNFGAPTDPVPTAGPSAACQPALAAIATYQNTVGSSWVSKMNAASRARDEMLMALDQAGGYSPATSDIQELATDFQYLYGYAQAQSASSYDTYAAQTNTDVRRLYTDCGAG